MQILILSSKFPFPFKDGGAIATYQTFKGLYSKARLVHLLSFNTSKHFIAEKEIPDQCFPKGSYSLVDINTNPGIFKAMLNLIFSQKPYILERFYSKRFIDKLLEQLKENCFDVIQIEGLYMLQYINKIREYSDAKIVYRAHNIESDIWTHLAIKEKNFIKKKYLNQLSKRIGNYEKLMINKYDAIIPISQEDSEEYSRLGNTKPEQVIPTGFDFSQRKENDDNNLVPNSLCYIGSLDWRPNQEGVLWFLNNCWNELKCKYPDLKLYIAGRNAPNWLVKEFLMPGINWVGEVESSMEFIKNKTILIVPLLSGSGMRIKIIEGFLLSKPIIATQIAAQGSNAEHENHLLIANEPEEFVKGILRYLSNKDFLRQISENGYNYGKSKFDNRRIIEKLYDFYKKQISN